MIVNVYKHTYKTWPKDTFSSLTDCANKAASILGIRERTVRKIIKENKENEELSSPQKRGPKLNFKDKYDEFVFAAIRRKVHQFFYRNEPPTIAKVLQVVNDYHELPNFSWSTMRKILKELNFKYTRRSRQSCLFDRQDIILWRKRYLISIKQYRREGRFIYYQDETWLNEGHTLDKVGIDRNVESTRQAFLEGLTTGLKAPSGKGRRLIISHIGSEEGLVEDGLLMFESKTNSQDYHQEMNSKHYEEWLRGILPTLKPNSVLVIDNAPYHSRKVELCPTTSWRKAAIQEWLQSKNINFEPTMIRAQLLEIVAREKHLFQKQVVDELAAEYGVTILRLPPYHCELNPIEMIWAQVKGHVGRNNKTFKMAEIKTLLHEGLQNVTPQKWSDCVTHTLKVEDKMCQLDHLIDDVVERFIINVTDTESESTSDME